MKFGVLVLLLLAAGSVSAQTTSVSGSVTDLGGQQWGYGSYSFSFYPSPSNPTGQYFLNGVPFNISQVVTGALSPTGTFSGAAVPDNAKITPSGSQWNLSVCPGATTPCYSTRLTVTGATQSLTINPPAIVLSLTNPPPGAAAYTDSEISGGRPGSFYYNITDASLHICNAAGFPPCIWQALTAATSILPLNNAFIGNNTFAGTTGLNGGGNLSGTFSGAPTLSGVWLFNAGLTSAGPISFTGGGTASGAWAFTGNTTNTGSINTFCRFENVRYVDPTNICGWSGADIGAWANSAVADLPSVTVNGSSYKQGRIVFAPGGNLAITQSTSISVGPFVAIVGPGPQQLTLNCTVNGDCLSVRDSPFNDNRGSDIGGFTILGQGSGNANGVGIHTGDTNYARFHDINIDNFTGTNSSCMWWDNQNGWSERNDTNVELGVHTGAGGVIQNGCTKLLRFTTSTNGNAPSFGYNRWDVRMSMVTSGQIGVSLESANPINFYNCKLFGNANMAAGAILFQITGTNSPGSGCFIDIKAESTGAATGWNTPNSPQAPFSYEGPGITENAFDGGNVADTVGTNSLTNFISPTNRRSISVGPVAQFGINIPSTSWLIPNAGSANSGFTGLGMNLWFDGANWKTLGDSVHNGGIAMLGTNGALGLFTCPDIGGSSQSISNASFLTTCLESMGADSNGIAPLPKVFANLGTPSNGHVLYCSDCNIANPCTGGGTGAIAKRLGGVWVCN